jgi:hypothetical protein
VGDQGGHEVNPEFYSLETVVRREAFHECFHRDISNESYYAVLRNLMDLANEENR